MMRGLHLSARPKGQILVGHTLLRASYALPRRTEIVLEGAENVPRDRTVFFAMNHTDRYNYWPFQYAVWRRGMRFTATWVKGKYFENRWMARFMIATNNIPLPSRGYVISTSFRDAEKRPPTGEEYRALRDIAEGVRSPEEPGPEAVRRFVDGGGLLRFEENFQGMIGEVMRLNREALGPLGLNVLVFPQGTRSVRLSKGHTGLAQVSQALGKAILPVGCSGSDKLYPGGSPWSKGGRVVYRIGAPLEPDGPELGKHRVEAPFEPLLPAASRAHGASFAAITEVVMARINALVDPPYRFAEDQQSDGVQDMSRFL